MTTPREAHEERLHKWWSYLPLCISCDDEGCDVCPRCSHCGDRFAERGEDDWLFYLPQLDLAGEMGWCSERCLSADCDSVPDPVEFTQFLSDNWWDCHVGDSGLCLTINEWAKVRTDREWRTFIALRGEVARQQKKAHETSQQPEVLSSESTAWRLTGELIASVESLLEHGADIPVYVRQSARDTIERARKKECLR